MTPNKPIRKPVSNKHSTRQLSGEAELEPNKPYELVPFPQQPPVLKKPIGHHRYVADAYHGRLHLSLTARTALHVSTGITVLGSDVDSHLDKRVPLIKTMTTDRNQRLIIQGSSLKGCIRAVYEAITNSTVAISASKKEYLGKIPSERERCSDKEKLCPASQVFGALNWQGLVHFSDARCQSVKPVVGFMPSLYRPRPDQRKAYFHQGEAVGRKFYYHTKEAADSGNRGTPVQQAGTEYAFTTQLRFSNLSKAQLGTLLISLGQENKKKMALKLGGGKPVGFGSVQVVVSAAEVRQDVSDRYTKYAIPETANLKGEPLTTLIQDLIKAAHDENLVEEVQLTQLCEILKWPTEREATTGEY